MIYNDISYDISKKYSYQDFTGQDLSNRDDMNNIIIYASCFSHETPDIEIFPKDLINTTFIRCNLSNCLIPQGNIIIDCNTTRFKVQNDLRDWELDNEDKPLKCIGEKYWVGLGLSVDAKDIPEQKLSSLDQIKKSGG